MPGIMRGMLASILLSMGGAQMAGAADMPVKDVVGQPASSSWTGFYLGLGGGAGWYGNTHHDEDVPGVISFGPVKNSGRGPVGTVTAGYDHQFAQTWVAGASAHLDWSNIHGAWNDHSAGGGGDVTGRFQHASSWAIGERIGYLVTPSMLVYETAGYAQAKFGRVDFINGAGGNTRFIPAQTMNGVFVGLGVEQVITENLSALAEYRYTSFGHKAQNRLIVGSGLVSTNAVQNVTESQLRVAVSYKFK